MAFCSFVELFPCARGEGGDGSGDPECQIRGRNAEAGGARSAWERHRDCRRWWAQLMALSTRSSAVLGSSACVVQRLPTRASCVRGPTLGQLMCQGDDASDLHAPIPQRPAGLQCGGSRRDDVIDDEYLCRREPPHVVAS